MVPLTAAVRDAPAFEQAGTWRNRGTGIMLVPQRQRNKTMSESSQYVGLDVSLKETSIRVIDEAGTIAWRGKACSTPEAISMAVKQHAPHAVRVGLESGQLSSWLFHELKDAGLPVICVDARHAKAALSFDKSTKPTPTTPSAWRRSCASAGNREVTVKGLDCQAVRALLVARAQIVSQIMTLKNCARGILKTFGRVLPKGVLPKGLRSQFPGHVRAAIEGQPAIAAIIEPMLQVLEATRAQLRVYDRAVIERARGDDTARRLMSAPGVGTVVALAYITGVEDPARFKRSSSVAAYFGMTASRPHTGLLVAALDRPTDHRLRADSIRQGPLCAPACRRRRSGD